MPFSLDWQAAPSSASSSLGSNLSTVFKSKAFVSALITKSITALIQKRYLMGLYLSSQILSPITELAVLSFCILTRQADGKGLRNCLGAVTRVKVSGAGSLHVSGGEARDKGYLTAHLDPLGGVQSNPNMSATPHCLKSVQEICKPPHSPPTAPGTPQPPGVLKVTVESSEFKTQRNNTGNGG